MRFVQTSIGALGALLTLALAGSAWEAEVPSYRREAGRWLLPSSQGGNVSRPFISSQHANEPALRAVAGPERGEQSLLTLTGLVVAQRAPVRAQVSGLLTEIAIRDGQTVQTGELMALLDDTEVRLEIQRQTARVEAARQQVEEAKLTLAILEDDLRRITALAGRGFASGQSLTKTRLLVEAQSARIAALQEQGRAEQLQIAVLEDRRKNHRATAPHAGIAVELQRHLGTYVLSGEILLYVEVHNKEILVQLPREELIQPEQLEFSLFSDERWSQMSVARIRPNYNIDGSRTVLLTEPPGVTLTSGQFVQVRVAERATRLGGIAGGLDGGEP